MGLSPNTKESLVTSHVRIPAGPETYFYIDRSFQEVPIKRIGEQLEKFGETIGKPLKSRSKPKSMDRLTEQSRYQLASQVERAITIPEEYRPTTIPQSEKNKIILQATGAAEHGKPIALNFGPNQLQNRVDGSSNLLTDLWSEHVDNYIDTVRATTHSIVPTFVVDTTGESWAYGTALKQTTNVKPKSNQITAEFHHTANLEELEQIISESWLRITPKLKQLMISTRLQSWQVARRNIREFHKEMHFEYRQHRIGPTMAQYGSAILKFEEDMEQVMQPLKLLGLSELTPQTILDMSNIIAQTTGTAQAEHEQTIEIPYTSLKLSPHMWQATLRRIALELAYNQYYQDPQSPIRITATDTTIFSKGFTRIGMSTTFSGAPSVGTLPETETPVLISSRQEGETRLFTPIQKSQYPTTNNVILERKGKKYTLPFLVTDTKFRDLVAA